MGVKKKSMVRSSLLISSCHYIHKSTIQFFLHVEYQRCFFHQRSSEITVGDSYFLAGFDSLECSFVSVEMKDVMLEILSCLEAVCSYVHQKKYTWQN